MSRSYGHKQGCKTLEKTCEVCQEIKIKYLTVYAFSTENWSRPKVEVVILMGLLTEYLTNSLEKLIENNIRVKIIGDVSKLETQMQRLIDIKDVLCYLVGSVVLIVWEKVINTEIYIYV